MRRHIRHIRRGSSPALLLLFLLLLCAPRGCALRLNARRSCRVPATTSAARGASGQKSKPEGLLAALPGPGDALSLSSYSVGARQGPCSKKKRYCPAGGNSRRAEKSHRYPPPPPRWAPGPGQVRWQEVFSDLAWVGGSQVRWERAKKATFRAGTPKKDYRVQKRSFPGCIGPPMPSVTLAEIQVD